MPGGGTLFRMAVFAYQAIQHYRTGLLELPDGYKRLAWLEGPGSERMGYAAESPSRIVIAFRGTEDWDDWKKDLSAMQTVYPYLRGGGSTHKGFTELYSSVRPAVLGALKRCKPGKALDLTGHSLGGAVASLCALDPAVKKGGRAVRLYTFGAPRVGDPVFAAALYRKLTTSARVYLVKDLVPGMPPAKLLGLQYEHAKRGYPVDNPGSSPFNSHNINAYAAALARQAPAEVRRLCRAGPGCCPPGL